MPICLLNQLLPTCRQVTGTVLPG